MFTVIHTYQFSFLICTSQSGWSENLVGVQGTVILRPVTLVRLDFAQNGKNIRYLIHSLPADTPVSNRETLTWWKGR